MGCERPTQPHPRPGWSPCTRYTFTVEARDTDGNVVGPYATRFDTLCPVPTLLAVDPPATLAGPLVFTFNKPMDGGLSSFRITPTLPLDPVWRDENRVVELWPQPSFLGCTGYEVLWDAVDRFGNPAAGAFPNPYLFRAPCLTYIVSTSPADGEENVSLDAPVVVGFSAPVDGASLSLEVEPPIFTEYVWSNGDTVLTASHPFPFEPCTVYTVAVRSPDLVPGPVPNPWSFTTVCTPMVTSTSPADGSGGVPLRDPIWVRFSEPMFPPSVGATFSPPAGNLALTWSDGNRALRIDHDPFVPCTVYWVAVSGTNFRGTPIVSGPVPNPWSFATICPDPRLTGLTVERVPPSTVRLRWNPVAEADAYRVYTSEDRLAPWPWRLLGETTSTWFDADGHLDDGLPHYYVVRAVFGATEGSNSTMAAKLAYRVSSDAAGTNLHWISLPYRSGYRFASDIANELTEANVDVVEAWDPSAGRSRLWYYARGAWRGEDFPLVPGQGIFLGAVRSFAWAVVGTDESLSLDFPAYDAPRPTRFGVALPAASPYARARDVVLDLEGSVDGTAHSKIVEVALWDGLRQTLWRFYWTPSGWVGTDFTLVPGSAIFLSVASAFVWEPRLITPEVP